MRINMDIYLGFFVKHFCRLNKLIPGTLHTVTNEKMKQTA